MKIDEEEEVVVVIEDDFPDEPDPEDADWGKIEEANAEED